MGKFEGGANGSSLLHGWQILRYSSQDDIWNCMANFTGEPKLLREMENLNDFGV
jgi:hypothetical protein